MRCIHKASGAVGLATDNKSQKRNKRNAFKRMAGTDTFKAWWKIECSRYMQMPGINLGEIKVEVRRKGRWVTE